MWVDLFLCLLLAHLVADYLLQTNSICTDKTEKKWRSVYHYCHALAVYALAWLVSFDLHFWWCAAIVGISHFLIDIWKSYREERVVWFVTDQLLHLCVIAAIAWFWCSLNEWRVPFDISIKLIAIIVAALICWKPSNIFIKQLLQSYSVDMPKDDANGFNVGALIGTIERWLILIFVCMQRYDALGLLIAAKSIIRFSEKDTAKTEYVLAGTLLSIFIAVVVGLMLKGLFL